jgi:GT2 family glycosyltransferase
MTLTAIVISRDWSERLDMCIVSLASNAALIDDVVLVIGSGDPCGGDALGRQAGPLRLRILHSDAGCRSTARNIGARAATGERLLFLDGDMLVGRDFVGNHLARMQRGEGVSRGRIRELLGAANRASLAQAGPGFPALDSTALARDGFEPAGYRVATSALETAVEDRFVRGADLPEWLAAAGANVVIERDVWDRTGGWNPAFGVRWGCEDLEFSYRLAAAHGLNFTPEATAYHLSHVQPDRWAHHEAAVRQFSAIHPDAAVAALGSLLGPGGSVAHYQAKLRDQIRSA